MQRTGTEACAQKYESSQRGCLLPTAAEEVVCSGKATKMLPTSIKTSSGNNDPGYLERSASFRHHNSARTCLVKRCFLWVRCQKCKAFHLEHCFYCMPSLLTNCPPPVLFSASLRIAIHPTTAFLGIGFSQF